MNSTDFLKIKRKILNRHWGLTEEDAEELIQQYGEDAERIADHGRPLTQEEKLNGM